MCDFIERLTSILEPTILDLGEKSSELEEKKKEQNKIQEFLDYILEDEHLIKDFPNQTLILDNLDNVGVSKEDYDASCYLLSSELENVKSLPQYTSSINKLKDIVEYFKISSDKLSSEVKELQDECDKKLLNRKYYEIFNSNSYVEDVDEFNEFIDSQPIIKEDKVKILAYVIGTNVQKYKEERV